MDKVSPHQIVIAQGGLCRKKKKELRKAQRMIYKMINANPKITALESKHFLKKSFNLRQYPLTNMGETQLTKHPLAPQKG